MTECSVKIQCEDCGHLFGENEQEQQCPVCGSARKLIEIHVEERLHAHCILDGVRVQAYYKGFKTMEQKVRTKLSKRGSLARESLVIDRTHPQKTVKIHQVEEMKEGRWEIVHDEVCEFPAKRRPERKSHDNR